MNKNIVSSIVICIAAMFVFPPGALFLSLAMLMVKKDIGFVWLFSIIMAMFLSFINCSKDIMSDSDLPWYTAQYLMAGKMEFIPYIFQFGLNGKGRELFFPTFNYIVYPIVQDNVKLYIFIHSYVCYFLCFYAIIRACNYLNFEIYKTIFPIVWIACFPWVFTYTSTLLRQFMAGAILLWIMVEHCLHKRKMVVPFVCMFLTHSSSLIFFPLLYLNFFKKKITRKTFFLYVVGLSVFVFIQEISSFLYRFTSGDNALSYALGRASVDTTFELPPMGFGKIFFIIICIAMCLYACYFKKNKLSAGNVPIANCIVFFNAFIIANLHQLELSNRLFFYSAMMSIFPLMYFMSQKRVGFGNTFCFFLVMNVMLFLYIVNSMCEYNLFNVLFFPINNLL